MATSKPERVASLDINFLSPYSPPSLCCFAGLKDNLGNLRQKTAMRAMLEGAAGSAHAVHRSSCSPRASPGFYRCNLVAVIAVATLVVAAGGLHSPSRYGRLRSSGGSGGSGGGGGRWVVACGAEFENCRAT